MYMYCDQELKMLTQSQKKYESQIQGSLTTMVDKMEQSCDKQLPIMCHIYLQLVKDNVHKAKVLQTKWHLISKLGNEQYFILLNRLATIAEGVCSNFLLLSMQDILVKDQIPLGDLCNHVEACHVSIRHMVEILSEYLIVTDLIFDKIMDQPQSDKLEYRRSILIDKVQLAAVKSSQCKGKIDDLLLIKGRHSLSSVFEGSQHHEAQLHCQRYQETMKEFAKFKETLKSSTSSLEKSLQQV